MRFAGKLFLSIYFVSFGFPQDSSRAGRPNVVLLSIDDLRPQLGCYGVSHMKTPNIDRLASEGVLFERHYVQFAVCIPSRVALLTSLRSERTRQVYGDIQWQKVKGGKPLGKTFSEAGYETVSLGKIWHVPGGSSSGDRFDIEWRSSGGTYASDASNRLFANRNKPTPEGTKAKLPPITESGDGPDSVYFDGQLKERAVNELKRLAKGKRPFLLAVGFKKPHLPFVAPKRFWDLYRENEIPLASNMDLPVEMPEVAFNRHPNFFNYDYGRYRPLVMGERMPAQTARHLIHAYSACVSYIDALVGQLLDQVKRLDLEENTVILLWGDHGFHLGDSGMWSKHSNFEAATWSPLIVKVPWFDTAGERVGALVETVDIFPTLLDLCGLPELRVTDGTSFRSLLESPGSSWDEVAYHVFNRRREIDGKMRLIIGHSIRTKRYRYVRWHLDWNIGARVVGEELYDYEVDPHETRNVVGNGDYLDISKELESRLRLHVSQYSAD